MDGICAILKESTCEYRGISDDCGVSPIVAILILIVVAIIGAATVGVLLGALSTNISDYMNAVDYESMYAAKLLIAGTPVMQPVNELISEQYMDEHAGVKITTQGGGNAAGLAAVGMGITDIGAISKPLTPDDLSKYPGLKPRLAGARAFVIIAHDDLVQAPVVGVSQSDLQSIYSQSKQPLSPVLPEVKVVVRYNDNKGSEDIFATWLTDGQSSTLDGYTVTPDDVSMINASDASAVYLIVSATPGAIGFIDWPYVSGKNPAADHVIVLPIVNKINGYVQAPDEDKMISEIKNLDNLNYDAGLVNQLYYVTSGEPGAIANDYIKYATSPGAIQLYRQANAYSVFDLQ
jgi:phosphate transport system substrate-binding protein